MAVEVIGGNTGSIAGINKGRNGTQFTREQVAAIMSSLEDDASLLAGAGAGKTTTAAGRVAYLLKKTDLTLRNIVCITYTESAAANLKERVGALVREKCGPDVLGLAELQIGTFHSIVLAWLRRFIPAYSQHRVLPEAQRRLLVRRNFAKLGIGRVERREGNGKRVKTRYLSDDPNDIRIFLDACDLIRAEATALDKLPAGLRVAYEDYLKLLSGRRLLDYAQILSEIYFALVDTNDLNRLALQQYVSQTIRQILVDEYQDVTPLLVRTLVRIRELGARFWVVGDVRQGVMGFLGGDPSSLANFVDSFPNAVSYTLAANFRSSPQVLEAAATLRPFMGLAQSVDGGVGQNEDAMYSASHHVSERGDLAALVLPTVEQQDAWGAERLGMMHGTPFRDKRDGPPRGLCWADMAVLVRRRETARRIATALRQRGIPVHLHGSEHLLESDEADATATLYEYLAEQVDKDAVQSAFRRADLGIGDEQVDLGLAHLDEVRADAEKNSNEPLCLIRILYDALGAMGFEERKIKGIARRELAVHNVARIARAAQDYEAVNHLLAPSLRKFADFAAWLRHQAPNDYADGSGNAGESISGIVPDAIHILTLHRAKSTEYPVVWMPDVNEGELPISTWPGRSRTWEVLPRTLVYSPGRFDGTREEEHRLAFVGITRAMRYLFITAPALLPKGRRLLPPSQILARMQRHASFVTDPTATPVAAVEGKLPPQRHHTRVDGDENAAITQTPSELFTFFSCPYQWKLRVSFGFPPPTVQALGHPDSIHAAIREFHERVMRGELPQGDTLSDSDLDTLAEELVARHHHVPYAPAALRPHLRAAALRKIRSYIREDGRRDVAAGETVEAVEQPISTAIGGVNVIGRYDVSSRDADGRSILDDLKTSSAAARRDPDLLVARTYALGYEALTGRLPARVGTRCVGAAAEHYRWMEMDEVVAEDMRLRIMDAGRAIALNVFPVRPAEGKKTCAQCDPAALCFNSYRYKNEKKATKSDHAN